MLDLSPAARRTLKSRAHHLRPYLSVGDAGLSPAVLKEIDRCLASHELIKIRVLIGERRDREGLIEDICRVLGASPVQHIGKILVIFRPRTEEPAAARSTAHTAPDENRRRTRDRPPRRATQGKKDKGKNFRRT